MPGEMTSKRNLVVVRAGPDSLHSRWVGEGRTWDLGVSSFVTDNAARFPEADYFDFYRGGKWDGIFQFFERNGALLDRYEYIWLPDDDIAADVVRINRIFEEMHRYALELGQPSLTRDSYFTHAITVHCPATRLRYTNFAEIMVPVLSAGLLRKVLPLFRASKSGWGIDYLWSRLTTDPKTKVAILDDVSVKHTRPVGSVLARDMAGRGESSLDEMHLLSPLISTEAANPLCFRALTKRNFVISGTRLCGLLQFVCFVPWRSRGLVHATGPGVFGRFLYAHLIRKPDLATLSGNALKLVVPKVD